MKLVDLLSIVVVAVAAECCSAFVDLQPRRQQSASSASRVLVRPLLAKTSTVVELEPEPEGGKELTAATSIEGCRMKEMQKAKDVKSDDGYQFWMTAKVEGSLTKEIRVQILKDASKKADFPGFRKGQVPPYAQPQITQFAVQESIIKTVEAAMDAYGLKSLPGSDGEMNVHEDVVELAKGWKSAEDSIQFTATLNAAYDPEKQPAESSDSDNNDDGVVDAVAAAAVDAVEASKTE